MKTPRRTLSSVTTLLSLSLMVGCGEKTTPPAVSEVPPAVSEVGERSTEAPVPAISPFNSEQAKKHQEAWAQHLGVEVVVANSMSMKMQLIPPGEFTMGTSPEEIEKLVAATKSDKRLNDPYKKVVEEDFRSEGPQHIVELTNPIRLSANHVTQQQFEELMGFNPSAFSETGKSKSKAGRTDTSRHPVAGKTWLDAIEFCNKLSEREGLNPYYLRTDTQVSILGGNSYRLPTEAEWEFACRAGTTTRWSFGDDVQLLRQYAWYWPVNGGGGSHPVGQLAPNPFGLFDMHGNVFDYCQDWYGPYAVGRTTNPSGPDRGDRIIMRGGCFTNYDWSSRSSRRRFYKRTDHNSASGFRVARTL